MKARPILAGRVYAVTFRGSEYTVFARNAAAAIEALAPALLARQEVAPCVA